MKKISKSYYLTEAIWFMLLLALFISTPPDFSKPADLIITIIICGFWLIMAIFFFRNQKNDK